MREIGQRLQQIRLDKAISLQDIEEVTKVRVKYLKAIEDGNLDILPGQIYAMGFIRSYIRYLGLNEEEIMAIYKEYYKNLDKTNIDVDDIAPPKNSVKANKPKNNAMPPRPIQTRQKSFGRGFLWLVLVLVILGSATALYIIGTNENRNNLPNTPPVGENPEPPLTPDVNNPHINDPDVNNPDVDDPNVPDANEEPIFDGIKVKVTVSGGNCWVGITSDSNYTEETLKDGDTREYMAEEHLKIRYGNAGVVTTEYDSEIMDPVGKKGEVKTVEYTKQ